MGDSEIPMIMIVGAIVAFCLGLMFVGVFTSRLPAKTVTIYGKITDVSYDSGSFVTPDLTTITMEDGSVLLFEGLFKNLTIGSQYKIQYTLRNDGTMKDIQIEKIGSLHV